MLQGIFTVCVSLQGMFIFGFHCARVQAVRDHWRGTFTSGGTTGSTSMPIMSSQSKERYRVSVPPAPEARKMKQTILFPDPQPVPLH